MKASIRTSSFRLALWLIAGLSGHAQGTFQNLNFEAASIPSGTQPSLLPISSALPSWGAYWASNPGATPVMSNALTQVSYDYFSLGGAVVSVLDTNVGLGFVPLQGSYSAALFGGQGVGATIYQFGLVPTGTRSLQLSAYSFGPSLIVTLGGQVINMVPLSVVSRSGFPASYTIYGGDISSFAGQAEQLSITEPGPSSNPPSELFLDNIVFSPDAAPEPSVFGLSALGALLVGTRALKQRRS
jgi:hypothetical protein